MCSGIGSSCDIATCARTYVLACCSWNWCSLCDDRMASNIYSLRYQPSSLVQVTRDDAILRVIDHTSDVIARLVCGRCDWVRIE